MSTALAVPAEDVAGDAVVLVAPDGLLSHVARPCPQHGAEAGCVARRAEPTCLVFWCEAGEHHFSIR